MSRVIALFVKFYTLAILAVHRFFKSFPEEWHKHLVFLLFFLTLTMTTTTIISKLYQFWDVGSDSWFDRLKGEGWKFQRGVATVAKDQLGDQFWIGGYLGRGGKRVD